MKNILITGASGYLGQLIVEKLANAKDSLGVGNVVATDVREMAATNFIFEKLDVAKDDATELFQKYQINCVIHLASILKSGGKDARDFEYTVDVVGTENILKACLKAGVQRIIVSSSGAAYGYHPENENLLREEDPVRGNYEFAYSYHKKLVEEMLAKYRQQHPELEQVIFRVSTILGERVDNQITDLFKKPVQIGICGTDSRFSIIWDMDAVEVFVQAIFSEKTGIYNLTGDGSVTIEERARILKRPLIKVPAKLVEIALWALHKLGLTQYGPEQTMFLKYRPVLDNTKLKNDFGYIPKKTSLENFEDFARSL